MTCTSSTDGIPGGLTWARVLINGILSGANDPTISTGQALASQTNLGANIGAAAAMFQMAYLSHLVSGVAVVGDANFNADDETFIQMSTGAAGTNTITLPAAAAGRWYLVHVEDTGAGAVDIDDQAGDTINGGAGPVTIHGAALTTDTFHIIYAEDGTNWEWVALVSGAGGGPATHEMFFVASMATSPLGDFLGLKIGPGAATTSGRVVWTCPSDFSSLVSVELVLIPDGTDAALDIDLASDYGADGEAYNTHSGADAGSTYSVTANQIFTLDISGVYANLAAGDYCGLLVTDNDASVNVYILGVRLVYNY